MNRIAKLVAFVLALVMALSTVAFAEDDSTVYTFAIMDPTISVNGEPTYDLSGLDVELSAVFTDLGVLGILLGCYAGENLDLVTSAQMQYDANGASFYLDGMSELYGIRAESFDEIMGVEGYFDTLIGKPARTQMKSASTLEAPEITAEQRFSLIRRIFSGLDIPEGAQGEIVHDFSYDRERSAVKIAEIARVLDEQNLSSDVNFTELVEKYDVTFEAEGILTVVPGASESGIDSVAIVADGRLYFESANYESPVAFSVDYIDDGEYISGKAVLDPEDKAISGTFEIAPVPGSRQVDLSAGLTVPSQSVAIAADLSLNTYGEDDGFSLTVSYADATASGGFYMNYAGSLVVEPDNTYRIGNLVIGAAAGEDLYEVESTIVLMEQEASTAAWVMDTTGMIDLLNMDEDTASSATMDLIIHASAALTELQELVPGLNKLLGIEEAPADAAVTAVVTEESDAA